MNALLVYPKIPPTFWSFNYAIKFLRKKSAFPPLGLLTVASMLPKEWNKKLIDLNFEKLSENDIDWADICFISAMTVQRQSAISVIKTMIKKNVKVVCGGPLFSSEPESFDFVDYLVLNEAELTLEPFLDDFLKGRAKKIYQDNHFADIKKTPPPMWDLINMNNYASMSVQFSRGCPFDCDFCNVTSLFGRAPRTKSVEQLITEIDEIYNRGFRRALFFVDDNLIGNKKLLKNELLPSLIKWREGKRGLPFFTEVSINIADDDELLKLMALAGFDTLFIGIETPNDESLVECSKHQNVKRNLVEDVRKINSFGLQVQAGFIIGFDSDTEKSLENLVHFIEKSAIVTSMVGLLQAPYGTKLYKRLKSLGRIKNHLSGDNTDCSTNIIPKMDIEVLTAKYREIIARLYTPKSYYRRVKNFLKDYNVPKIKMPLSLKYNFEQMRAFFKALIWLGVFGKERFYFWKLLIWTTFIKPKHFPLAVSLAIFGFHFRKVFEHHFSER